MKILIVKASALGDIIHCFPSLHLLRNRFPQALIDWVVERPGAPLLEAHPDVRRVLVMDSKKWRKGLADRTCRAELSAFRSELRTEHYDLVFDFQGNLKSSLILASTRGLRKIGYAWGNAPEWMHPFFVHTRVRIPAGQNIRDDYLHMVRSALGDWEPFEDPGVCLQGESGLDLTDLPRPIRLVCPGAAWINKQLLPEAFAAWLQRFEGGYFLLLWGNQAELVAADTLRQALPDRSQLLPRLTLPTLQALMAEVDHVIAMDSLPLHLAGTTATPTWGIFGPSSLKKYLPLGAQHRGLQGSCPYGRCFEKRCPKLRSCGTGACVRGLDADALSRAFD